jgi:hypothetical protein
VTVNSVTLYENICLVKLTFCCCFVKYVYNKHIGHDRFYLINEMLSEAIRCKQIFWMMTYLFGQWQSGGRLSPNPISNIRPNLPRSQICQFPIGDLMRASFLDAMLHQARIILCLLMFLPYGVNNMDFFI